MNWTEEKPSSPGWYWYKEIGKNRDEPMMAWVFGTTNLFYACRYGPHELLAFRDPHRVEECPGVWCGPIAVPE